ncbi:sphingosine kinase 1-like [Asterias amurensis]|uniref:sphingosine kinase 1-like n=1 Tax=Asterias amurensis TaxID=7602 RepID=UPI003AB1DB2B
MSSEELNSCVDEEIFLLQDDFILHPGKCSAVTVTLYPDRLEYEKTKAINGSNDRVQLSGTVRMVDVVGCECGRSRGTYPAQNSRLSLTNLTTKKPKNDTTAFVCLHSYAYNKPVASGGFRSKRDIVFRVNKYDTYEQNLEIVQKWRLAVLLILRGVDVLCEEDIATSRLPPPRKLLVLINPASGRRKGKQIFLKQVMPLFRDAELDYKMVVTDKQFQAMEIAATLDPNEWQGIVVVAGDGLVYEVLNGMMKHQDPQSVLKVPIGIIPAGSGNALFAAVISKLGEQPNKCTALHAAFLICKGGVQPIDVVTIVTPIRRIYSFLAITWGIIADIDIESERFRWMGKPRFTVGVVIRILNMRRYRGSISFLPVENPEAYEHLTEPKSSKDAKSKSNQQSLSRPHSTVDTSLAGVDNPRPNMHRGCVSLHDNLSDAGRNSGLNFCEEFIRDESDSDIIIQDEVSPPQTSGSLFNHHVANSSNQANPIPSVLPPRVSDPLPSGWVTVEGDFVGILITYLSHIGEDVNVWPDRKFDEGVISIQYINFPTSRRNMVEFVDAIQTGRHLAAPYLKSKFVKAFRMEPQTEPGIITVDGEQMEYGPVQGEVLPYKANIILPTHIMDSA